MSLYSYFITLNIDNLQFAFKLTVNLSMAAAILSHSCSFGLPAQDVSLLNPIYKVVTGSAGNSSQ